MPIHFIVNRTTHQIDAVAIGPIRYADVEQHLSWERQEHGLSCPEFVDARQAEINFTPKEVRQIVELLRKLGRDTELGPTAVLVSTEVAFGVIRMLEVLLEDVCAIRPFRDEPAARKWLAPQI